MSSLARSRLRRGRRWNRSVSEESDRHAEEESTHTARHLSNGPWT